jgi:hypothetical protein
VIDAFHQLWQRILDITALFVIPDWGALIGLLPIFLVIGVLGPIVTLLALAWFIYAVRAPRRKLVVEEGPTLAPIVDGRPAYPEGEPYCPVDALVYPFGATTCERCGRELMVRCPKCSAGRPAAVDTCGNCGLILKMSPRARALRPAGPPPGGAAAA